MRNILNGAIVVAITLSVVVSSLAILPQSADAQLFQRRYQRRCCDPCRTRIVYRPAVRVQPANACCYGGPAWNAYGGYGNYAGNGYFADQTVSGYSNITGSVYVDNFNPMFSSDSSVAIDHSTGHYADASMESSSNYFAAPGSLNNRVPDHALRTETTSSFNSDRNDGDHMNHGDSPESYTRSDLNTGWQEGDRPVVQPDSSQQDHGKHDATAPKNEEDSLTAFYAGQIFMANQNEIELSQLATEKASSDAVKQFAEMLQADHQKVNERLRTMIPHEILMAFPASGREMSETDAQLTDQQQDRETELSNDTQTDRTETSDRVVAGRANYDKDIDPVVMQLCQIEKQAAEFALQSSREMLNQYSGQDFDMGFVGLQIARHSQMQANLRAMKGVGTSEFRKIVSDAQSSVDRHLEKALELSRQLDDDRQQTDDNR